MVDIGARGILQIRLQGLCPPGAAHQVGAAIWAINLGYTMIGSLLFVNFYPWT
jgi:hypothetical protein